MVYFPDEVFRNIASYLIDPYKAEKEKHASVWKTIRVKRERWTVYSDNGNGEFDPTHEDEYHVYINTGKIDVESAQIRTDLFKDDHTGQFENMHQYVEYSDEDGEMLLYTNDLFYNYVWKEYRPNWRDYE